MKVSELIAVILAAISVWLLVEIKKHHHQSPYLELESTQSKVIELPNPIHTCQYVYEPYLHCANGTIFDPSGSGDPRTNNLNTKVRYKQP